MQDNINPASLLSRRELLQKSGAGLGAIALLYLLHQEGGAVQKPVFENPLLPKELHFPAKAKNVICIHLVGAPSQLDLFDYKPVLQEHHGEDCPAEYLEGQRFAFIRGTPQLFGSPYEFSQHGESGMEMSELLPHLANVADKISIVKTLQSELINHGPAQIFSQAGIGQ